MAGAGFKSWVDGDILTAGDVNTYLMQQAVMVFADASARTSAIAAPSEGMVTYLTGTDVIEYYDGAAWQPILDQDVIEAKGDLIVGTADDAVGRLAVGTDGYVLTADSGETTGLKWAASSGAGKVLQVVTATDSTQSTTTSTSLSDTGLSASITPSAATSKILVLTHHLAYSFGGSTGSTTGMNISLVRDATTIANGSSVYGVFLNTQNSTALKPSIVVMWSVQYLDSPATTSSVTYKTQYATYVSGASARVQEGGFPGSMTLLEIGA